MSRLNMVMLGLSNDEKRRQAAEYELNRMKQSGEITNEEYNDLMYWIQMRFGEGNRNENQDLLRNPMFLMLLLSSFMSGFNRSSW